MAHYSKIGTLHEVDFTVIEDHKVSTLLTYNVVPTVMFAAPPQAAMDQLLPGPSGAGGLAGYLHAHARTATKAVVVEAKGSMTADVSKELADNPYYITRPVATTVRAAGKKTEEAPAPAPARKKVPVSAGDVCSLVLTNEDLCRAYAHVTPLLQVRGVRRQCSCRGSIYLHFSQVYLVLTTSSAECERGVSVLGLVLTAPRNRITQATLEQANTTTQSNTDTRKHALPRPHPHPPPPPVDDDQDQRAGPEGA